MITRRTGASPGRTQLVVFASLSGAYLLLDAAPVGLTQVLLKGLLMPALLWWVVAVCAHPPRALVVGLLLATVGDVGLEFEATFMLGMAGFLGMQIAFIAGFVQLGALRSWRAVAPAVGYLLVWVGANLLLGPQLGDLRIPVLGYSLALCAMAALGASLGGRIGVGGLLFLVSDTLIAAGMAGLDVPGRGAVVMVTYLTSQYLIASGWVARLHQADGSTLRRDPWVVA